LILPFILLFRQGYGWEFSEVTPVFSEAEGRRRYRSHRREYLPYPCLKSRINILSFLALYIEIMPSSNVRKGYGIVRRGYGPVSSGFQPITEKHFLNGRIKEFIPLKLKILSFNQKFH
jgi:hypothetical protein